MKRIILGALGATALIAGTAPVALATEGSISGTFAFEDNNSNYDNYQEFNGAIATEIAPNWSLTLNGDVLNNDHDDHYHTFTTATAGAVYNGGMFAIGAHTGTDSLDNYQFWNFGVDGALNLGQFQVTLSYDDFSDTGYDGYYDFTVGRLGGTFFINENMSVGATITDYGDYVDYIESWGVDGEYQLSTMPLSFTLGYVDVESGSWENSAVQLGARWSFGGTTVQQRRQGSGMFNSTAQAARDIALTGW